MAIQTNLAIAKVTVDGKELQLSTTDKNALHKPDTAPTSTVLVGIDENNGQVNLKVGEGITITGDKISVTAKGSEEDNITITKNNEDKIQSIALKDTTNNETITANTIRKAITIRRYSKET